jgi:hypothetical protein
MSRLWCSGHRVHHCVDSTVRVICQAEDTPLKPTHNMRNPAAAVSNATPVLLIRGKGMYRSHDWGPTKNAREEKLWGLRSRTYGTG